MIYAIYWQDYDCTEILGYTTDIDKAKEVISERNGTLCEEDKLNSSMFYGYVRLEELE